MYDTAREAGIYPYFHQLTSGQDTVVQMEGRRTIMIGSNNYLGFTSEPEVIEAGIEALKKYGTDPRAAALKTKYDNASKDLKK